MQEMFQKLFRTLLWRGKLYSCTLMCTHTVLYTHVHTYMHTHKVPTRTCSTLSMDKQCVHTCLLYLALASYLVCSHSCFVLDTFTYVPQLFAANGLFSLFSAGLG